MTIHDAEGRQVAEDVEAGGITEARLNALTEKEIGAFVLFVRGGVVIDNTTLTPKDAISVLTQALRQKVVALGPYRETACALTRLDECELWLARFYSNEEEGETSPKKH